MTIDKKIEVMQAYKDGAEIECRHVRAGDWRYIPDPIWNWSEYDYRIKEPEPTKGKVWIVVVDGHSPSDGVAYKRTLVCRGDINNTPAVYGTKAEAMRLAQSMKEFNPELTYTMKEVML